MSKHFGLALVALSVAIALSASAEAGTSAQDQGAQPFATRPHASTSAFSTTPRADTRAFSQSPAATSSAFGAKDTGQTTAFGHGGNGPTESGNVRAGTTNARRAANSFDTGTDTGASPVGGHNQSGKSGG